MNARDPFDSTLNQWLEEGPMSAPREDLAAVLEGIPRIRQGTRFGPWRLTMPTVARIAVAAVLAIAVGAIAYTQLADPSGPAVGTEPSPTPGWEDRFPTQSASMFIRPFTYALDPATMIELNTEGTDLDAVQFRNPEGEAGHAIVLRHEAGGVRLNPCSQVGGAVNTNPTPREFVDYMKTVPGLKVTELAPMTIDGRTALGIDVVRDPNPSCPEHFIFAADDDFTCCWPDDPSWVRRIWALDVGGALITIATPYGPATKDKQIEIANAFVGTFHFIGPDASPDPSKP